MPRKYLLTPIKSQRRWMKKYKGKRFSFGFGKAGGTQESSYAAALAEFLKWRAEVDARANDQTQLQRQQAEAQFRRTQHNKLRDRYGSQLRAAEDLHKLWTEKGNHDKATRAQQEVLRIKALLNSAEPLSPLPSPQLMVEPDFAPQFDPSPIPADKTIATNVDLFLKQQKQLVSLGRNNVQKSSLNHFLRFAGGARQVQEINAILLGDYHLRLIELINGKEVSPNTAYDRVTTVKQFVSWLWERGDIELPRNLQRLTIKKPAKAIEIIPDDDLRRMLAAASERTRLYILLALNCGFTQKDIAFLRQDNVQWPRGRIIRKRSKTQAFENVPTVTYQLWPETFRLLKKHRSDSIEIVLLNEDAKPLYLEGERDGKYFKVDNVRSSFNRLLTSLTLAGSFKLLRKSSSSKLDKHAEHGRYVQHFLGHAPSSVADRHYVQPSQERFDAAINWLGQQFGLSQ